MSIVFSNTTTKAGIIQLIERKLSFPDGAITGDSTLFAQFTGDVNLALDRVYSLIFDANSTWQFDDNNHTDYPIITTTLTSGQKDYTFTNDGSSNLILEIHKVMLADENGLFREISPINLHNEPTSVYDGLNTTGLPNVYKKSGNGIILDPIPNYTRAAALKIYISREGSYFLASDTTKKAGFAGLFHEYLAIRPACLYAEEKLLAAAPGLRNQLDKMEAAIVEFYKAREKDVVKRMTAFPNSPR